MSKNRKFDSQLPIKKIYKMQDYMTKFSDMTECSDMTELSDMTEISNVLDEISDEMDISPVISGIIGVSATSVLTQPF